MDAISMWKKNVFHKSSFEICLIYISENETWWRTKIITKITETIKKKTGLYFKCVRHTKTNYINDNRCKWKDQMLLIMA